jgi:hypothetical protein
MTRFCRPNPASPLTVTGEPQQEDDYRRRDEKTARTGSLHANICQSSMVFILKCYHRTLRSALNVGWSNRREYRKSNGPSPNTASFAAVFSPPSHSPLPETLRYPPFDFFGCTVSNISGTRPLQHSLQWRSPDQRCITKVARPSNISSLVIFNEPGPPPYS